MREGREKGMEAGEEQRDDHRADEPRSEGGGSPEGAECRESGDAASNHEGGGRRSAELVSREGACENGHCGDCSTETVKGIVMESSEPAAAAGTDIVSAVGACGKGRGEEGKQEKDGDGEDCAWLRVYISWRGSMEIVRVAASENSTVGDICSAMLCEPEVDPDHKLLVFNGLLLEREWGALSVGIFDSCVLHLVLSDAPYKGRVLYVKGSLGPVEVRCDDTFLIEDVKQAASCFPGMPPVESQNILFCGRFLQDEHTLRQYNIQKPCVLNLLPSGGGGRGRGIENFVKSSSPEREEHNVPLDRQLEVQMTSVMSDESHYHGMMLGSPDLSTLTHDDVELVHVSSKQALDGALLIDPDSRLVTFTPSQPLREASHYRLTVNSRAPPCQTATGGARGGAREWHRPGGAVGLMHSKGGEEPVHGRYEINFYTQGYVPVRQVSIHPRPHSRVRSSSCAIALSFSSQVDVSRDARGWVQVRGHKLLSPRYDTHTCTLIYPFETPPPPGRVHVMLHAGLVAGGGAGAEGSTMMPLQPDGITRSNSVVRWQFYCSDESQYETHNLSASGLLHVMARWRSGRLDEGFKSRPRRRGNQISSSVSEQEMAASTSTGLGGVHHAEAAEDGGGRKSPASDASGWEVTSTLGEERTPSGGRGYDAPPQQQWEDLEVAGRAGGGAEEVESLSSLVWQSWGDWDEGAGKNLEEEEEEEEEDDPSEEATGKGEMEAADVESAVQNLLARMGLA